MELYEKCPKYSRCSVNACPLDSKYPRYTDPRDKEQTCKLSKDKLEMILSSSNKN